LSLYGIKLRADSRRPSVIGTLVVCPDRGGVTCLNLGISSDRKRVSRISEAPAIEIIGQRILQ
jgi:hypothetical protein